MVRHGDPRVGTNCLEVEAPEMDLGWPASATQCHITLAGSEHLLVKQDVQIFGRADCGPLEAVDGDCTGRKERELVALHVAVAVIADEVGDTGA